MASIRKLPSGKWQATVLLHNGKRTTYSHPMRKAVENWAKDLELKRDAGDVIPDKRAGRTTLAAWWQRWESTRVLEKSTRGSYGSAWRLHIKPHLGDVSVSAITRMDIEAWQAQLAKDEVGSRTRVVSLNVLSAMLDAAAKEGLRPSNPCVGVARPRDEPAEPMFLTRTEALRLLGKMDDSGMASVMLFCGLRWSEAAAVKGDAIDWFRSQLVVRRAVTKSGLREYGKSKKSRRTVPVYAELLEDLSARLEGRDRDGLLFPNPDGGPWDYSRWRRQVWLPAVDAAKLPGLTPHDLRHTYASWLVEAGVDLYRVQVMLGHSSPQMTMRYARFRPDAFGSVADVMRAVTHPVRTDDSPAIESGSSE